MKANGAAVAVNENALLKTKVAALEHIAGQHQKYIDDLSKDIHDYELLRGDVKAIKKQLSTLLRGYQLMGEMAANALREMGE